ncbi:MAG: acyl-CoA dehydrogenase family protein [Caldimonas sp.]
MQDDLLGDSIEQLLAGVATPQAIRDIEGGGSPAVLWNAIEESGFCDALVAEDQGGAGLGLADVFPILEACGRHALPLPLAQTMTARALLSKAGHSPPGGSIALATNSGAAGAVLVSYGAVADRVLLADGSRLALLDAREAVREPFDPGSIDAWLRWPADVLAKAATRIESSVDLRSVEACLLAAQMSGAMRQVLLVTLQYANERTQFGRSIGKFQAIQHQLSVMAEHTEAGRMAARMACATGDVVGSPLLSAVAKARTSEAAALVASIAHAVHGAIGITEEYDLQLCTRRLHSWRAAAGAESYWNMRVGRALLASRHATVPEFVRHELSAAPAAAGA